MNRWPEWLRRRTGVDHVWPPAEFFAWAAIVVAFVVMAYVGGWNAAKYPITLGYDYNSNAQYMHVLLDQHRLPRADESAESNQPPLYYLVGGLASRAGHALFGWHEEPTTDLPEHTYRGAQILNVLFVLLTALLLLLLARRAAPRTPGVWAAALLFFAFLPVVSKTAAMIHSEPLNMLLSTLAVWLTVRICADGATRGSLIGLGVVLVADLATRASAIFTVGAILVALAVAGRRRLSFRSLTHHAAPLALIAVLAIGVGVWIHSGAHIGTLASITDMRNAPGPKTHFFDLPTRQLIDAPFRSNYVNAALPITYTEIWGDWIGAFAWSTFQGAPVGAKLTVLKNQASIGLIPTALALVGYALLLALVARRKRELLVVALLPPLALAGYLIRSYQHLSPDGDIFKASYVLTTAPIWALCFGLAYGKLGRFRLLQVGLACALLVFGVLELKFMLYGLRDGTPPY